MSRFIMKESPDVDFYIEWDRISSSPTFGGTRAEMVDFLYEDSDLKPDRHPAGKTPEDRLARADQIGTSYRHTVAGHPLLGSWEDTEALLCALPSATALVPRPLLGELTRRLMQANWEDPDLTGLDIKVTPDGEDG